VKVSGVTPGSPAEGAGLRAGDVVVGLAGKPVASLQEYSAVLKELAPGDETDVVVDRGGQTLTIRVRLAAR
jgi:S1-C subfamily serine protease